MFDTLLAQYRDREVVFQNMMLTQRLASPTAHLQAWIQFEKPIIAYINKHTLYPAQPATPTSATSSCLADHTPTDPGDHPDTRLGLTTP
jgi:hypothetical protein